MLPHRLNARTGPRRRGPVAALLVLILLCFPASRDVLAQVDELDIVVTGVRGDVADNVRNHLGGGFAPVATLGTRRDRARFLEDAEARAIIALRPFGFYGAQAEARLESTGENRWRLELDVTPGPPVQVESAEVRIEGPGAHFPEFTEWRDDWPLGPGTVLNQVTWEQRKQDLLDRTQEWGFFEARFTAQRIDLDLERNRAALALVLDTGPRAVMGAVSFEQDFLDEAVLRPVPRFEGGEPYRAWVIDQFRTDLWKLGYFDNIDVDEVRDLDAEPPVVDLVVTVDRIHRNTHQGTIGYGTDTEFRTQYRWQRHQLSYRGDSLGAGFAWQSRDERLLLFAEYRLPRRTDTQQYWILNPVYSERDRRYEVDVEGRSESIPVADGRTEDFFLRAGRAALRNPENSREQIVETVYLEFLDERQRITQLLLEPALQAQIEDDLFRGDNVRTLAVGIEWDWPSFQGQGFHLLGHRERAWLFTANEAWGSDRDFTQGYFSSRWNLPLGDRWRLLLRGELGYTDADVRELTLEEEGETFRVSVTDLPFRYRFFAGGSHSVRGYDFEELSNNGIGSNHLVTASVELEYQLREQWSVAAFVDAGNAFNDWSEVDPKAGYGVGVRWYTVGFPLRLDIAQARDLDGEPWRLHFTIGSPLF